MNGKTQSILLQVAFKQAADRGGDVAETKTLTSAFYGLLSDLHAELNINADDGAYTGGNSGGGRSFPPRERKALPASVTQFTDADGVTWNDFRAAKTAGDVVAKHPEFKTTDSKKSVWEHAQDGSPNPEATALKAAADQMASLTAPY